MRREGLRAVSDDSAMLDTEDADEDTDWAPDVDVGLEAAFFDLLDMAVSLFSNRTGAKINKKRQSRATIDGYCLTVF